MLMDVATGVTQAIIPVHRINHVQPVPMTARLRGLAFSLLAALPQSLAACGAEPHAILEHHPSVLHQAIVAGAPSRATDFPATGVILYHSDNATSPMGAMLCSGTLVAPDVVLAAAHCQEVFEAENGPHVQYYFSLAQDVSRFGPLVAHLPDDAIAVKHFLPHPDYVPQKYFRGLGRAADLGLFFLSKPVTSVPPATLVTAAAQEVLAPGAKVTVVGYGRRMMTTFAGRDEGNKHQGESTIRSMGQFEMQVGAGKQDALKCHGDSGGPTYLTLSGLSGPVSMLVGITSRAHDWAGCSTGGIDTRVDAYLPWIKQSLAWACDQGLSVAPCSG